DDPVVDHGDAPAAIEVRMRVRVGRLPVRRPSRVADADASGDRLGPEGLLEAVELARALEDRQLRLPLRAVDHAYAGGVVAPVAERAQAAQEDREGLLRADVTDDAAH